MMEQIHNIGEFVTELAGKFPRYSGEVAAWTAQYQSRLAGLKPADLTATFEATLLRWTKVIPPKPGELFVIRASSGPGGKHPLNVSPPAAFDAMTDEQFRWWQHQNGELFLSRLGYWKRMRIWMDEHEAAEALKRCRNEDECYRVFDQWRHNEPLDPMREPTKNADIATAGAAECRANLAALAAKTAFMKGGAPPKHSPRMNDRMRALADQHRASQSPAAVPNEEVA